MSKSKTTLKWSLTHLLSSWFKVVLFVAAITGVFLYTRAGAPTRVEAAANNNLNFQARLLHSSGGIVSDGTYSVAFNLYENSVGGSSLWTETQASVTVKNGYLSVYLGSVTPFPALNWSDDKFLTMNVNADGEMAPRLKLSAVPYAFRSQQAEQLRVEQGANTGTLTFDTLTDDRTILLPDEDGTVCLTSGNCVGVGGTGDILQGGNSFGGAVILGSNDTFGLELETDGVTRMTISTTGLINLSAYNCSALNNGGKLTVDASGDVICDDDGGGGGSTTTLQQAYDNDADGSDAVITLTAADGAILVRDASSPLSGNLFAVQSNNGSVDYFAVDATGAEITGSLDVSNGLAVTSGGITVTGNSTIAGTLSSLTGISSSGTITFSGLTAGGLVKAGGGTGTLSVATAGTDYENPLTFDNGLTRSSNAVKLGGALTANTDVPLGGFNLTFSGSGTVGIGTSGTPSQTLSVGGTTGNFTIQGTTGNVSTIGSITAVGVNSGSGQIQGTGGLSVSGNVTLGAVAGNTTAIGNATGTLTVTGNNSSTFVLNGTTVTATEFNRLSGKDAPLVDTNDAVNTAITGTGVLASGSIASGFGTISTANNITTSANISTTGTGTVTSAGLLTASNGLTMSAGNFLQSGSGTFATGTGVVSLNGPTDVAATTSLATKRGADYTTPGSANNVAISTASLYRLDTSGAAQTITGIVAGRDGQLLTLINADAALAVTLSNLSGSSSAANQISTGTGSDVTIAPGATTMLIYDAAASLWRVTGEVAGGTGLAFIQGGNNFGVNAVLGTNGAGQTLGFKTAGTTRAILDATGNLLFQQASTVSTTTGDLNFTSAAGSTITLASNSNLSIPLVGTSRINLGTSLANQKINLYESGNLRYGLGIASGVLRVYAGTGGNISFGIVSSADGSTYAQTAGISSTGTFVVGTANQFQVTNVGAVTAVGVNSGTGLIQGTGGLTVTGAASINTTGTGNTAIGNGTGTLSLTSNGGLNVTTGGAVTGVSTLSTSGIITVGALGAANTDTVVCRNGTNQLATCSSTFATVPASGSYLQQVPTSTATNTVTPTANSVVGLTVNGTSGTATTAVNILQGGAAVAMAVTSSSTGNGANINLTNTSGTQTSGLAITRNATGGTTTSLLDLTNTLGTATNAIRITGTYTNILNSPTVNINNAGAITGATGITSSGTIIFSSLTPDRLVATTTGGQLTNTITAANLLSSVTGTTGTGNLVFSAGPTFTGTVTTAALTAVGTVNLNATGAAATNVGTGTGNTAIGNGTGTLTLTGSSASAFILNGINVSAAEFNILDGGINLASAEVTGTLGVANGGTGAATLTQYGVLYGNGTGIIQATGVGTTNQCLLGNTGAAPTWGTCPATGSFSINGTSGSAQTISNGDTILIAAGTNITTTAAATDTITVAVVNNPTFSGQVTASAAGTGLSVTNNATIGGTLSVTGGISIGTGKGISFNGHYKTYERSYSVNTATPLALVDDAGTNFAVTKSYRVKAVVTATGTPTGATAIFYGNDTNFTLYKTYEAGTTSNHIEFFLDSGVPSVRLYSHASFYNVSILTEEITNKGRSFGPEINLYGTAAGLINIAGDLQTGGTTRLTSAGILQNVTNANAGTFFTGGTLGVDRGGTGFASYTVGDLLYASGATTLSKLAAVASGSCLISQGVGVAPIWGSCASANEITGTGTANQVAYFNGTNTITSNSNLLYDGTNLTVANNATFNGDILLGSGDQIDFADEIGDKVYYWSNTYGRGIESGTITDWTGQRYRIRTGGTSASTGTERLTVTSTGLKIGTGDATQALDVTGNGLFSGSLSSVGLNANAGLIQGTLGLTVSGATISLNENSNHAVNIGTGTSTGLVTIGGGAGTFSLQTTNINISNTGAVSGVTTLSTTSTVTVGTLGSTDTDSYSLCRDASSGQLTACDANTTGKPFLQGGNTFAAQAVLGTNDANSLAVETANTTRFVVSASASTLTGQGATTINSTGTLALNTAAASSLTINTGNNGAGASGTLGIASGTGTTSSGSVTINTGNASAGTSGNIGIDNGTSTSGSPQINIGTTNARAISIGNSNTSTVATFTAGTYNLNIRNTGVGINATAPTAGSVDLFFGNGANRTINVNQASSGAGNNLTIQAGRGATGANAGGSLVLQGGAQGTSGGTGSVIVRANGTDSTAVFVVQNSSSVGVLTVDTITSSTRLGIVQIGSATTNASGTLLVLDSFNNSGAGEGGLGTINGAMYYNTSLNRLRCYENNAWKDCGGTVTTRYVTLTPEFEGAVLRPDGSNNIGFMISDFCSNEGALSVNTTACGNSGSDHSYYEWSHNESTNQDYDIYLRWKVPDNFDGDATFSSHVSIVGFASKSAASTNNSVVITMYNDQGARCGTNVSQTNIVHGTANQWGSGVAIDTFTSDADCDDIDPGEYVTFVIRMVANNNGGAPSDMVRMGNILIGYKSKF